jgi:molybdopterin synthase catalytic subunit
LSSSGAGTKYGYIKTNTSTEGGYANEKELARLSGEAKKKWQICRMAIVHRIGPVQITEPSVMIAVSAAHREAAFAACRFAIEEIKKTVPIWKKEVYEGGEIWIGTQSGQPLNRS